MNLFEDLKQRVTLLNSQLRRIKHEPASETGKILHAQLWRIVEELNERLGLRLENTALDLYIRGNWLVIRYFDREGNRVFLRVGPSFSVERQVTNRANYSAVPDTNCETRVSDLPVGEDWCWWGDEEPRDRKPPDMAKQPDHE